MGDEAIIQHAKDSRLLKPLDRSNRLELMDGDLNDPAEVSANLRDIRRLNRWFGGSRLVLRHLPALFAGVQDTRPVTILDIATGSADIPLAIQRWATQRNRPVAIVASDLSEPMLEQARRLTRETPEITIICYDATALPLPEGSFDIVLCSLALHHFDPAAAVTVIGEMERTSRAGFLINDLVRNRPGLYGAWLAGHLTTRNRLTRHDAPLSVRRAYTPDEMRELCRLAGAADVHVATHAWFRMAALRVKPGGSA